MSADEIIQLEQAITALEAQRALLGEAVIHAALAPLREKLAALRSATPTEPQRKLISVLFADLSGFTAVSELLDAEDVTTLINALWERIDHIILDHGGRIDKHIGDAVMAFWGADAAREDDAERAILAALAMQKIKYEEYLSAAELHANTPPMIRMRIGVNTGPVLLSEVATTHEFTAIGDAVNTASRLEHACPPGGVLISHDSYQHVRGLFDLETQTPLSVKGKAEPVQTYLVTAARPRRFRMSTRGIEGIETRTVGREAEMLLLQEAYDDAVESAETRMVSVVGDPGIGKSRLLFEFENWISRLPQRPVTIKARATPETQHHPAGLLHNLFSSQFEILDTDPPAAVRLKFLEGMARWATPEKAALIGQLAGFDFSDLPSVQAALKNPGFDQMAMAYLVSTLRTVGERRSILLLLEDLHWADDRSLDLLTRLLNERPDHGLLAVCLARPALFERRVDWGGGQAYASRLELKPLSTRHARILVAEILQRVPDLPYTLRDTIVHTAEGNPFYIEEMIKMLLDQGVICRGNSGETPWKVTLERMQTLEIPSTLTGVLQARLDALLPAERESLQRASVVGRLFWDASVHFLAGLPPDTPPSPEQLAIWDELRQRELIFRRERSAFAGAQEFIFKHALLRDVSYESVLKRLRRRYHRLAAEWLVQAGSERVDEYADQIAAHWALAEDPAQEGEWQGRAGIQAAAHHAHAEALRRLQRALDLTPSSDPARRYNLLLHRIQVLALQGKREAQRSDLDLLENLAGQIQDPAVEFEAALRRSDYLEATGDYPAACDAAQRALEKAQAAHDPARIAEAHLRWGAPCGARPIIPRRRCSSSRRCARRALRAPGVKR